MQLPAAAMTMSAGVTPHEGHQQRTPDINDKDSFFAIKGTGLTKSHRSTFSGCTRLCSSDLCARQLFSIMAGKVFLLVVSLLLAGADAGR